MLSPRAVLKAHNAIVSLIPQDEGDRGLSGCNYGRMHGAGLACSPTGIGQGAVPLGLRVLLQDAVGQEQALAGLRLYGAQWGFSWR